MAPQPFQPDRETPSARTEPETFACPSCSGSLGLHAGVWTCADCGYAPRHGAD